MHKKLSRHGGNRLQIMAAYGLSELIDFSSNINPLGPPPEVNKVLKKNLSLITEYPPERPNALEKKLARYHGVAPENIIVGNGSNELIYLLPYILQARHTVITTPGFSEYERACLAAQRHPRFWPTREEDDFACHWKALFKAHGQRAGVLFVSNPNNPTGRLITKTELLVVLEKVVKSDFLMVVDEAFLDFVAENHLHSLIQEATQQASRIFVLRSLTKFYAIPGLRLGYGVGNPALIAQLKTLQPLWSVNCLSQAAGESIMDLKDYQDKTRAVVKQQRQIIYNALLAHPFFKPFPGAANYLFVKIILPGLSSSRLQEELVLRGCLIRNCANFRGLDNTYFRLAVRTPAENQKLLTVLEEIKDVFS